MEDSVENPRRRNFLKFIGGTAAGALLTSIAGPTTAEAPTAKAAVNPSPEFVPICDNTYAESCPVWTHDIDGRSFLFQPFSSTAQPPLEVDGKNFDVSTNSFVDTATVSSKAALLREKGALSYFGLSTFIPPDFIQNNPKFLELKEKTLEAIDQKHLATLGSETHDKYILEQIGKTVKRLVPYKGDKNQEPFNTWDFDKRVRLNATDCLEHSFLISLLAENIGIMHNPYSELVYFGYKPEGSSEIKFHVDPSFKIGDECAILDTTLQERTPKVFTFSNFIRHFETEGKQKVKVLNTFQIDSVFARPRGAGFQWENGKWVSGTTSL